MRDLQKKDGLEDIYEMNTKKRKEVKKSFFYI